MKCPKCQSENGKLNPGKYECYQCKQKFIVDENLSISIPDFSPGTTTVLSDFESNDPDQTMPGKRDRKSWCGFEIGDLILNRYKILSVLGQGGMGVVYRCLDETAGVEIALKMLPPELSRNIAEIEDIKDNFQLVSKLVHQNIAILRQLERDPASGDYYLIMEFCNGEDLRRWIRRKRNEGKISVEEILPIIRQIADALDYAHNNGLIHRDIKPGNIMIDRENKIKVLDFGLAAQIHTSISHVSMVYQGTSGTGPYMAPEQWRGKAQGAAADQYALAVMTYEMIAGHLPFDNPDTSILRQAVLEESPDEIPGIDKIQQQAIARALRKNPEKRFKTCSDFAEMLGGTEIPDEPEHEKKSTVKAGEFFTKAGIIKYCIIGFAAVLVMIASGIIGGYLFSSKNAPGQKKEGSTASDSQQALDFGSLSSVIGDLKSVDEAAEKFKLVSADYPQNIMDIKLIGKPEVDEKKGTEGDMVNMTQKIRIEVNYQKYVEYMEVLKKIFVPFAKEQKKGVWTIDFNEYHLNDNFSDDHIGFLYRRAVGKLVKKPNPKDFTFESYKIPTHLLKKTLWNSFFDFGWGMGSRQWYKSFALEYYLFNKSGQTVFLGTFVMGARGQLSENWRSEYSSGTGLITPFFAHGTDSGNKAKIIFLPFIANNYTGFIEETLCFKIHKDDLKQVSKSGIKAIKLSK